MSKFEIKNFFQFEDGSANFSLNTAGGFYYDCKLVAHNGNHFIASAQSRSYDKSDGSGKGYVRAFGAQQGTAAAQFFDEVTEEAKKQLRNSGIVSGIVSGQSTQYDSSDTGSDHQAHNLGDDDIPF